MGNRLEFFCCEGCRATIVDLLARGYQNTIDPSSTSKDERDQVLGENKLGSTSKLVRRLLRFGALRMTEGGRDSQCEGGS
jgi:hypothetical protein